MELLEKIINDFSNDKLITFLRLKIPTFRPVSEDYLYLFEDKDEIMSNYETIEKIGEAELDLSEEILILAAKTKSNLTNRSSKKRQYEIAKKIIKEEKKDGAIFVFYDSEGSFRFSFIRATYEGANKEFTTFKRYTYFVSKNQTNKTFKLRMQKANFNSLDSIQESFSVEPLTKEFYDKLQRWYFWAIKNSKFPKDAENTKNGREIALIRLITRLMFVWFMKVKGLVPDSIFDKNELKRILKDFTIEKYPYSSILQMPEKYTSYYKAILQNLFFATLNTKQEERRFREEKRYNKGYNKDYGNHSVFRYHWLFCDDVSLEKIFGEIPFLNGGLFECLDEPKKKSYVDGFTEIKTYQPIVPNFLFFSEPEKVNIGEFFGEKNRQYEVEGLINILQEYNFTIDENEPDDVEVALDPELLGSIFENLLASYNPETATTARKATGSFYTPREIVNFMVDESLKEYFKTHLSHVDDIDKKLDLLIKSKDQDIVFDKQTTKKIIDLINDLRVVDPAVGSGAFPMAILNKLVFILKKLDPDNEHWKQSQIESIEKYVKDPVIQRKLIEKVDRQFADKNADYGRKLYLIEKCIYGVDIQQIAVEIAKLRFFISLLVDEEIDKTKKNYGIEPLPNLDFKLMQGNSLISKIGGVDFIGKEKVRDKLGFYTESKKYVKLVEEFEDLKHQYQNEPDSNKKRKFREDIEKKIKEIFEEKLIKHIPELKDIEERAKYFQDKKVKERFISKEKRKLRSKLGFDIEEMKEMIASYTQKGKEKNFFLWNIYFAEVFSHKGGFDIVIGNPPYIQLQKTYDSKRKFADIYKNEGYETFTRTGDIYTLFYEKGLKILNDKGVLCFITSNKWMRAGYGEKLREFLSKYDPVILIDLGPDVFDTATVDTNILLIKKDKTEKKNLKAVTLTDKGKINSLRDKDFTILSNLSKDSWIILTPIEQRIKEKIERIGTPLKEWDIKINYGIKTGFNDAFIIDGRIKNELIERDPKSAEIIKPILRGRDIKRYRAKFADKWLINTHSGVIDPFIDDEELKKMRKDGLIKVNDDYSIEVLHPEAFLIEPINIGNYPAIREHLDKYWDKLVKRQDKGITPYNLRHCAYLEEFEKEKIVWQRITQKPTFCVSSAGEYILDSMAFLSGFSLNNGKYIVAILNSKLVEFWVDKSVHQYGTTGYRLANQYVEQIPIPPIPEPDQQPFINLVDTILAKKERGEDTSKEEFEIDMRVYELYGLTDEEIRVVDPDFEVKKKKYNL